MLHLVPQTDIASTATTTLAVNDYYIAAYTGSFNIFNKTTHEKIFTTSSIISGRIFQNR